MIDKKQITIDISVKTVLKIVLVFLILGFLYLTKSVVFIFIVAVIFSSVMMPAVNYLKNKKIPRTLSVIGIYLFILILLGLAFYLVIPIVSHQIGTLTNRIGDFFNNFLNNWGNRFGFQGQNLNSYIQKGLESFVSQISSFTQNIYNLTVSIVGGVATAVMILVLAFYLTLEENAFQKLIQLFLPRDRQKRLSQVLHKAQGRMGLWLGGEIIMCFVIFTLSFIAFSILGIDSAFTLALIMGILEIIPYFGPLIGGTAAALVAFSQSFWLGIVVIVVIILIQQLENHVLVPNIMKKVTGLSSVIIILAILIGIELFGLIGMIIAIPVAVGISVVLQEYFSMNKKGVTYKSLNRSK